MKLDISNLPTLTLFNEPQHLEVLLALGRRPDQLVPLVSPLPGLLVDLPRGLFYILFERPVDIHFVDINVASSGYPTGRECSYSVGGPRRNISQLCQQKVVRDLLGHPVQKGIH